MSTTNKQAGFLGPLEIILVVLVVAVIGIIGWRAYDAANKEPVVNRSAEETAARELPDDLSSVLSFDQIKESVAAENPDSTITGVELKSEHGVVVYSIRLSNGTTLYFNASTGQKVTKVSSDDSTSETGDDSHTLPSNAVVTITFAEAQRIAKEKFPNSKIHKIELSLEEGKVVYSVRFTDKARVDIDAANGAAVRVKTPGGDEQKNTTSSSDDSSSNSGSNSGSSSGSDNSGSGNNNSDDSNTNDDNSNSGSSSDDDDNNEVRVEGTLDHTNNVYSVTENGKKYTLQLSANISSWVGKKVRAEGTLVSDNVIKVEKVDLRS